MKVGNFEVEFKEYFSDGRGVSWLSSFYLMSYSVAHVRKQPLHKKSIRAGVILSRTRPEMSVPLGVGVMATRRSEQ